MYYSIDLSRGKYPDLGFYWTARDTILEVNKAGEIMRRFNMAELDSWNKLTARGLHPAECVSRFEEISDEEIIKFIVPRRGPIDCLISCVAANDVEAAARLFRLFSPKKFNYGLDNVFRGAVDVGHYSIIKFLCDYME